MNQIDAVGFDDKIVRRVELLAFEAVDQDVVFAVVLQSADGVPEVFAGDQTALVVDCVAVAEVAGFAERRGFAAVRVVFRSIRLLGTSEKTTKPSEPLRAGT